MIRTVDINELNHCFTFVKTMATDAGFFTPDIDAFVKNWTTNILNGSSLFLVCLNDKKIIGMFAGIASPEINSGVMVGTECLWYVEPEYRGSGVGKSMLFEFERWAILKGCKAICTATPCAGLHIDKYRSIETLYIKEI